MIESFREVFGRVLVELGEENLNIVVLDVDVKSLMKMVYFERVFFERFI